MKISDAARNAAVDAITALIDSGGGGTMGIRTGSAPSGTGDADSGTLLATFTLNADSFAAASSGSASANSIADATAVATNTAAHFRIYDNGGTVIAQGTVTATSGGGDLELTTTSITTGDTITVTSLSMTLPAGS